MLPEGKEVGLKEAKSSEGGCRPREGSSRVLAGEAGVFSHDVWMERGEG